MKRVLWFGIILFSSSLLLDAQASQRGKFTAIFSEHSLLTTVSALAERMGQTPPSGMLLGYPYRIIDESFEIFVPKSYDGKTPYGAIVWVSPSQSGAIYDDWQYLMEKHHLIWIGANRSGNDEYVDTRRIPLALEAAHNIQKRYKIDPMRLYIAGLSGGGRVSSMAAIHYSDIFSGGIFIIGANYWEKVNITGKQGDFCEATMSTPKSKYLSLADIFGRYVYLTGDNDGNRPQMQAYYEAIKKFIKNVTYMQVPGMGHEKPAAEWFEKAIEYLDTNAPDVSKPSPELKGMEVKNLPQSGRIGQFTTTFTEYHPLSNFGAISSRMKYKPPKIWSLGNEYKLEYETFEVYVPQTYNPGNPFGLIVWISPGDSGEIPKDWKPLMDKHRLIWVGANKVGNEENVYTRRIPLALDAAFNMQKLYNIDLDRVYVSGLSGGGRVSSMAALHFPDVFSGGIFVIGANYWGRMFVPGEKGKYWNATMTSPQPQFLSRASQYGRYVLLTGDTDSNQPQMRVYYEKGYQKSLKNVLYLQVPGMGHEKPSAEWYEKAIEYLDTLVVPK